MRVSGVSGGVAWDSVIEPTFKVVRYGQWEVLRVHGEIDMATAPLLRQQVQAAAMRRPDGLIVDLDAIDFIDSTGLGVMVGAAKRMRLAEAGFRIVTSQPHLNDLFELTRLNEVFDLFDHLDDALADVAPEVA